MHKNEQFIHQADMLMKQDQEYYLFYLDINNFQSINFMYGTAAGDALLKDLNDYLNHLEDHVLIQRAFSDSFLILSCLHRFSNERSLLENYNAGLRGFFKQMESRYASCNFSFACGCAKLQDMDVVSAIDKANFARKEAKHEGIRKIVLYDDKIKEKKMVLQKYEHQLATDIEKERFFFYLQPKVDLINGRITGAEALVRKRDEQGNLVSPDDFLPLLEDTGSIIKLDYLICRQVCAYLKKRMQQQKPVVQTSINLSRKHIFDPNCAEVLNAIVDEYEISHDLIEFELTETILLEDFTQVKMLMDQLRNLGYSVSIDDFGSGYAGINIWQELDFDLLKLDKKFLSQEPMLKKRNHVIVPNLINIAQQLQIKVLCEGVETREQCHDLLMLGCTIVQGFYFSEPIDPKDFYAIYDEQDGCYDVSFLHEKEETYTIVQNGNTKKIRHRRFHLSNRWNYLFMIVCSLVLCVSIVGVILYNNESTHTEFIHMVEENMTSFIDNQKVKTLNHVEDVQSTLRDLAILVTQNEDEKAVHAYVEALDEENKDITYEFFTYDELMEASNKTMDQKVITQLQQGKTVVTDVVHSHRLDIDCIGIALPVKADGKLIGAVRAVMNAEELVSTSLYSSQQGTIISSMLVKSDGTIVKHSKDSGGAWKDNLLEVMKQRRTHSVIYDKVSDILHKDQSTSATIRLGEYRDMPYYLSIADMDYNDWHLVVCLQADTPLRYSQNIIWNTTVSAVIIVIIILTICALLFLLLKRIQQRFTRDEQRYLLLEQFSDTVLFDYSCQEDLFRCTKNATKLLRLHGLNQKNFLKNLNDKFIYPADKKEVNMMLTGHLSMESGEVRIRLMRSEEDHYFWASFKYKYIYERGRLVSVIGKITDIDTMKQHEEYLIEQAEIDGLTTLYNKTAVNKRIKEQLLQGKNGILIMVDIDRFKRINDIYGHMQGDKVLHRVAALLLKIFETGSILGRVGGDEMLVFVKDYTEEQLEDACKVLRKEIASSFMMEPYDLDVSLGAARYPQDKTSYEELYQAADKAMYQAKTYEGSYLCWYDPDMETLS